MTDPDPRHDHIYRITCTVCGDSGTLRVSIDPGAQEDTAQRVTDAFMAEEISDGHSRWQVENVVRSGLGLGPSPDAPKAWKR